ncbi:MAG: D-glycero-beta-D-manno-heptose 1-phosphate adenylyltransferase [Actinobacteria bacterium]|nr:MAG: D-glycero-beta-D-manno-heptose 1-phosphate adenylyltransferase [Actinomycetota bacterium]
MGLVVSADELEKELLSRPPGRVVFTNGCFDLLHVGHLSTLRKAKGLGDILVVGVNSDASVRRLKGAGRPFVSHSERAELVAALEPVDFVVVFEETTPEALIARIRPDVHVKGGDYAEADLPEARLVRSYGGEVVIVEEVAGKSTTELARRLEREGGSS